MVPEDPPNSSQKYVASHEICDEMRRSQNSEGDRSGPGPGPPYPSQNYVASHEIYDEMRRSQNSEGDPSGGRVP